MQGTEVPGQRAPRSKAASGASHVIGTPSSAIQFDEFGDNGRRAPSQRRANRIGVCLAEPRPLITDHGACVQT